ncbi:UbiX family flavin prenyltransferase [Fusibacter bizertensis]|jgi:polyprenyl P-hydroxybenzoate and phenylacrylic acid decarboxylases|uniref:Flavin prenyltransferase UbiX n=1 Tax=Fusibacter bizertensis TaxID=1488331 RepID=A0ABT6NBX5_9FIRM|nr:UbiX family flavin prenyltransferase [Fusibacter bizertensis]MDH8677926.1 UbiX family flavin prenyltransferase [Fusibacter bizertensis]
MKRIIVGLTGASGSILAYSVIEQLLALGHEVHFVTSKLGEKVMAYEMEDHFEKIIGKFMSSPLFIKYDQENLFAAISSGSFPIDGMCIVPCSMGTMGKIAGGIADSLICRAADVTLKEKRPLVLVTRETPLSGIHLENMLKLTRYGAVIMPPVPAFYNRPKTVKDIVDQTAARVLRTLGIQSDTYPIWSGNLTELGPLGGFDE